MYIPVIDINGKSDMGSTALIELQIVAYRNYKATYAAGADVNVKSFWQEQRDEWLQKIATQKCKATSSCRC